MSSPDKFPKPGEGRKIFPRDEEDKKLERYLEGLKQAKTPEGQAVGRLYQQHEDEKAKEAKKAKRAKGGPGIAP